LEGSVVGTAHYMSPEQARGEVSRLDRRTDVYALGATLYALLTGQPPISGENALEVIGRIATEEPRRPRALDPDLPADLEAVVLKCLEKDRSARYDSARALAQDLDRFLRDEPVQARSGALALYRLRKRLRKHRMAVSVGAVALALVLVALGWGALQRREAAQRERLARRFTERVERIEAQARYSTLSRLHDTRGDREKIRAGLAELEEEIRGAGPSAAGPGQYAMGRGQLALGDDARARASLESAWAQGFREPRAAYALALVMGHLYQRRLLEVERMRNEEQREFWKREAEQRYRAPALAYLKESGGADVPSAEYVAALVDYYEGRLDKALERLDAVGGHLPWFYEAPALRGDILLARASAGWRRGEHDLARADFEAGRRAYAVAGAIGESDPSVHERLGELEHAALVMELYSQGEVEPQFTRGLAAAERALAALADDPASLALEARLYRSFAEYRGTRGGAEEELLSKAVAAAERAIAAAPEQPAARVELARTYRQWGEHLQGRNQNPGEPLRRALQVSAGFGPDEGGYELWANLGLVHKIWADYQDGAGEDSKEHRDQAIQAFAKAISLDGHTADPLINLGSSYFLRASGPGAGDQEADLEQAAATLEKARLLNPRHAVPYFYLGRVSQQRAQLRRSKGEDPAPELARALEWYRAGIAVSPKLPHLYNSLGLSLLEEAKDAWDRGGHPGDLLESAKAACEQAITVAPKHGHGYNNLGEVLRARAAFQRDEGQDPTAAARAAAAAYAQALQQLPDQPIFWANAARTQVLLADHALEQGGAPGPFLAEASAAIDEALRCNARKPEAHLALAELRSLRARVAAGQGRARIEDYEGAAQSFRKAMELAPQSQEGPLAFGHFCLAWASWSGKVGRDPGPPLAEGLAVANRLVKDRPAWPSALILRANLLLDLAGNAATAGQAFALAGSAARDFTAALRANPNLGTRWRARALLAQRLAAGPQESGR
ncbi:MAG TPA: serine/threonine protein kinase, partial [Myxococcaceae bacterium]